MEDIYAGTEKFERPASTTPFGKLPEELNTKIFDFTFGERSRDVSNCRLACQDLFALCSPYLIRTAVVAERINALRKLREVSSHPFFSQHVTTLVWDASYYETQLATEYSKYEYAFERSDHLASSRDEACIKAPQADVETFKMIESGVPDHPRTPASLRGTGQLLEYGMVPPIDDEQGVPLSLLSRAQSQPEDVLSMRDVRNSNLYRYSADYQEGNHMRGCHTGFAEYHRRWENQNRIRGRDWTVDRNQAREYLFAAFANLPKLRNLVHSSFRALAYNGESYMHLCQRPFGDTVLPHWANVEEKIEDSKGSYYNRFQKFMDDILSCGGTWDSISFGRHPFETNYHDTDGYCPCHSGNNNMRLNYDLLWRKFSKEGHSPMNVRCLRLPLLLGTENSIREFGGLSTIATDTLTELELGECRFYQYWNDHKMAPPSQQVYWPGNPYESLWRIFTASGSALRNLRSLSLRGFVFSTNNLRSLLLRQPIALRTLHLIDCYCTDGYKNFTSIMQTTIQPVVRFDGVEIFGLRFRQLEGETEEHEHKQEYEEKLRERCAYDFGRNTYMEGFLLSDWPWERPELETAILGGKVNSVARKMYAAPNDEARWYGQDMPNRQG